MTRVSVEGPRVEADVSAEQVVAYLLREGWHRMPENESPGWSSFYRPNGRQFTGWSNEPPIDRDLGVAIERIARAEGRPAADVLASIVGPVVREVVGNGSATCEALSGRPGRERRECRDAWLADAPTGAAADMKGERG